MNIINNNRCHFKDRFKFLIRHFFWRGARVRSCGHVRMLMMILLRLLLSVKEKVLAEGDKKRANAGEQSDDGDEINDHKKKVLKDLTNAYEALGTGQLTLGVFTITSIPGHSWCSDNQHDHYFEEVHQRVNCWEKITVMIGDVVRLMCQSCR